ncbi:MAG: hypothetical protein V4555_13050 [Acidobacteriota bacterium]
MALSGTISLLKYANIVELTMGLIVLAIIWRKRLFKEFPLLVAYLCVQTINVGVSTPLLFFRKALSIPLPVAYPIYFWTYWACYILQSILLVFIIHSVFSVAMRPLEGLHDIGKIIFRWVAAVSVVLSICIVASSSVSGHGFYRSGLGATIIASQIQQSICILTLCLLLFVCFAARPLGLTFRSRIFGVSLGLGSLAATNLIEAAWYSSSTAKSLYSPVYLLGIGGCLAALSIWGAYFVLPEPERKMILLPTTSPFFFWNRVSEALGDAPGHVAVAGFKPDMLAAGELTMLTAMSKAARDREQVESDKQDALAQQLPALQAAAGR